MKSKVKWFVISGIPLVVITLIVWNVKILGISSTGMNEYSLEKKYYLSYNYQNVGIVYPKISEIVLLDYNNKAIPKENNLFSYEFFIDEDRKTGVLTDDYALVEDIKKGYRKAKGYKVKDKDFQVILAIVFHNKLNTDFTPYMRITYNIFGIKKHLKSKTFILYDIEKTINRDYEDLNGLFKS